MLPTYSSVRHFKYILAIFFGKITIKLIKKILYSNVLTKASINLRTSTQKKIIIRECNHICHLTATNYLTTLYVGEKISIIGDKLTLNDNNNIVRVCVFPIVFGR